MMCLTREDLAHRSKQALQLWDQMCERRHEDLTPLEDATEVWAKLVDLVKQDAQMREQRLELCDNQRHVRLENRKCIKERREVRSESVNVRKDSLSVGKQDALVEEESREAWKQVRAVADHGNKVSEGHGPQPVARRSGSLKPDDPSPVLQEVPYFTLICEIAIVIAP